MLDTLPVFLNGEINDAKAVGKLARRRTDMIDVSFFEFLMVVVAGVAIVGQQDFWLESCLFKSLNTGDYSLNIG